MLKHCAALRLVLLMAGFFLLVSPARAQVIISEFMASNTRTLADEEGEFSDWIELLNSSGAAVNLDGWALTDDRTDLRKWRFPTVSLSPGEHLVVFASNKNRRIPGARLHTNFKLSGDDYLALVNAEGAVVFDYGATFPEQVPDVSFGVVAVEKRISLVAADAEMEVHVPADGALESFWNVNEFDSSGWESGPGGIGYDAAGAG
ncbi:MAG TPA: lamin tail domain-containing protein, partial [Verrucomicrobiae bacterium]|nr:lamin tail domain-containing protein [Verrucomicrobiae bacterium]